MRRPRAWIAGLLLAIAATGCKGIAGPNWLHPGTAQAQQASALRYDPYPDNDAGPPIVGGRPRDYQVQPPEPSRARWFLGHWGQ